MKPGTLKVFYNSNLLLVVDDGEPKLALDNLEHDALKTIYTAHTALNSKALQKNSS